MKRIEYKKGVFIGNFEYVKESNSINGRRKVIAICPECKEEKTLSLALLKKGQKRCYDCFITKKGKPHNYKEYTKDDIIGDYNIKYICEFENHDNTRRFIKVMCHCGNIFETQPVYLINGDTKSCGCKRWIGTPIHGLSKHWLYSTWNGMKMRCYNKNRKKYPRYGGRGIIIYKPWLNDFKAFYDYASRLPRFDEVKECKLSIDRIDNNSSYVPGNIRWATAKQQRENQEV